MQPKKCEKNSTNDLRVQVSYDFAYLHILGSITL